MEYYTEYRSRKILSENKSDKLFISVSKYVAKLFVLKCLRLEDRKIYILRTYTQTTKIIVLRSCIYIRKSLCVGIAESMPIRRLNYLVIHLCVVCLTTLS
jgi:hypothetical protein